MKRREFITLLGCASLAWPLAARAQQHSLPVVAFINGGAPDVFARDMIAFRKGLNETGYVEGQNVTVEYHWLEGQYDHLPALMADLVHRQVAVIATPASTPASLAAKAATASIPVVFGVAQDPVALGLVTSLAHPGGNATGINFLSREVNAKRLGLMHEFVPTATRFAVLVNPANASSAVEASKELGEAARALGLEIVFFNASNPGEIDAAFDALARERERCGASFIAGDGFFTSRAVQFATLTAVNKIPATFANRAFVAAGGLMSYGSDFEDMFHQVGVYTSSILKGARPTDLPVMQSTKFEFVINLQTARSLHFDIPATLLARADDVIE